MNKTTVHQVEQWFAENKPGLSRSLSIAPLRVQDPSDFIRGTVCIEITGPSALATITFWNKGDVEVLVLEKVTHKDYQLDYRMLTAVDDVSALLRSYFTKLTELMTAAPSKPTKNS